MKIDNPLSREFLLHYPVEAARTLEHVSVEHVAALFTELPAEEVAAAVASMLPERATACLDIMSPVTVAKLVTELSVSSVVRLYRLMAPSRQSEVSKHLSDKTRDKLRHYMMYPTESAGALLNPKIDVLPQNITVADAQHRLERLEHPVSCEIYIIDDAHHLVGLINLGRLLSSSHHARLQDIMNRKTQPISAHAPAKILLSHPGWTTRRSLPVVERDNTLVGVLDYNTLRDSVDEIESVDSRDPLENMLSLASLFWLSLAQLLDSILSIARPGKGDDREH